MPQYTAFNGERAPWWVRLRAEGKAGHASRLLQNTAVEALLTALHRVQEFRAERSDDVHAKCHKLGDVTSVNITNVSAGGIAYNVVPAEAEATLDIRLPPSVSHAEFEKVVEGWAGDECTVTRLVQSPEVEATPTSDKFVRAFVAQVGEENVNLETFPAATDSRFLRAIGIPVIGFSPMRNTPVLLHEADERLHRDVFTEGLVVMRGVIEALVAVE